ncbi:hypothetical protein EVA_16013 [gut metagenome]|uniref:Uncharacterized protein n=1 Tax=gut metagenome TaxID=749906 RepID=J9FLT1_9ZZZZ
MTPFILAISSGMNAFAISNGNLVRVMFPLILSTFPS